MNYNNKYRFQFKHFSINDSDCAMKIGTDGVLLGAWADVSASSNVLDIGSGSGLISLMAAQRSNASITGIEIDPLAAKQSIENIKDSHWSNRISIINSDFVVWASMPHNISCFDHIVSNPPFFNNGPVAPNRQRATARHSNSLGYDQLIKLSKKLLTDNGKLSIISPVERQDDIIFYSELEHMFISRLTHVYSRTGGKATRLLWEFSKIKCTTEYTSLSIRETNNNFSQEYINLTTDFYLNI